MSRSKIKAGRGAAPSPHRVPLAQWRPRRGLYREGRTQSTTRTLDQAGASRVWGILWGMRRISPKKPIKSKKNGAQGRNRTTDTAIFSRMLYQLSYLGP